MHKSAACMQQGHFALPGTTGCHACQRFSLPDCSWWSCPYFCCMHTAEAKLRPCPDLWCLSMTQHTVPLLRICLQQGDFQPAQCGPGSQACSRTPSACLTPAGLSCLQQEYFSLLCEVQVRRRVPREPSSPRRRDPDAPASLEELWQRQQQEEQGVQQPACNGRVQGSMENGQGPAKRVRFMGAQAEGSSERSGGSAQVGQCCLQ